jgi:hypothetical protein
MGIHDGGEWQLKVRSWELEIGRKVLWEEGGKLEIGGGEEKKEEDFWQEIILGEGRNLCRGAQSFVASFSLIFFCCVSD